MAGGLTPICNECGVSLCWDIATDEYEEDSEFWDAWKCQECNGGKPFNKAYFSSVSVSQSSSKTNDIAPQEKE